MAVTLAILGSTAPREAARLDLALTRGGFLLAGFLILLPAGSMDVSAAPIGTRLHLAFSILSLVAVMFLAVRLGGDSVGDYRSGMLEMLFVTELTPGDWLAVRVVQVWLGFASVWVLRLPFLFFIYTLGGIRWKEIVAAELLLLTAFLLLSSLALFAAFNAKSRQDVGSVAVVAFFAWEFLLAARRIAAAGVSQYAPGALPNWLLIVTERVADIGVISRFYFWATSRSIDVSECGLTSALYAALSAFVLWVLWRLLARVSRGMAPPSLTDSMNGAHHARRARPARGRCWDDALAWQAYAFHGGGARHVRVKCVVYFLLGTGLLLSGRYGLSVFEVAFTWSALLCGVMMLVSAAKPSDCLSREIRDQTMPLLLLTPHDSDDFYASWQRGARHLAWPDLLMWAVMTLASFALDPIAPPIVIAAGAAILLSGPFLMLSPLLPFTFAGIAAALTLFFFLMVILGICVGCAAVIHPITAPALVLTLGGLFNQVLRRHVLPFWMEQKMSSIV